MHKNKYRVMGIGNKYIYIQYIDRVNEKQSSVFKDGTDIPAHNLKVMGSNPGYLLKSFLLYH